MILSLKDLEKVTSINVELDLTSYLEDAVDLIALNNVLVTGTVELAHEKAVLDLSIRVEVVQKCARSLKPVPYDLNFKTTIVFSNDLDAYDFVYQDDINLSDLVFAEIMLEKEPVVYHQAHQAIYKEEDEASGHPAFQVLKKDTN